MAAKWEYRGKMEYRECMSANLCLKERGKEWGQGVKMERRVFVGTLFGCARMSACVHVFTCPRSSGREKAENEIKSKQLYWRSP